MTTTSTVSTTRTGWTLDPLVVTALVYAVLAAAGAALGPTAARPDSTPQEVLERLAAGSGLLSVAAVAEVCSALTLVAFVAVLVKRLRRGGEETGALQVCTSAARLAAMAMIVGALAGWTAVQSAVLGDVASTMALATLWFAASGPGFGAAHGMLLLGLSAPALATRGMPRLLGWAAVVLGGLSVLGAAALAVPSFSPLLPIGRFGGVLVLLAAAIVLGRTGGRR